MISKATISANKAGSEFEHQRELFVLRRTTLAEFGVAAEAYRAAREQYSREVDEECARQRAEWASEVAA